jgi:hypothetical protein
MCDDDCGSVEKAAWNTSDRKLFKLKFSFDRRMIKKLSSLLLIVLLILIIGCSEEKVKDGIYNTPSENIEPSGPVINVEAKEVFENPEKYLNQRINTTIDITEVGGPCPDGLRHCENYVYIVPTGNSKPFIYTGDVKVLPSGNVLPINPNKVILLNPNKSILRCTWVQYPASICISTTQEYFEKFHQKYYLPNGLARVTGYLSTYQRRQGYQGQLWYSYQYGFVVESYEFIGNQQESNVTEVAETG